MNWEQIKEGIWAAAALVFLVKFWMLHGRVTEFLSNHWPTFVKQVGEMDKKIDKNSEGIARLEGGK